jgi:hypothetical protein
MKRNLSVPLGLATVLLTSLLATPAFACGGFFCNLQDPINQAAERVLYIAQGGKITVHIQIAYQGPPAGFSWVLPLQKKPEVGIGSDSVFTALEQRTSPQFVLEMQGDEKCQFNQCPLAMASAGGVDSNAESSKGVTVLEQKAVGPYLSTVLAGDTGQAVRDWLDGNGYGQPKETAAILDVYAKKKFVFLALKLLADKDVKDLAPVVVSMDEPNPCLPIRLTKIAAEPDMPIVLWMLGDHRAIPKNFLHVTVNDATIDWMSGGNNYWTVVSKAVDQASGHAFTTEFAGKAEILQGAFVTGQWDTSVLKGKKDRAQFLTTMFQQGFPRTRQVQYVIQKHIPKPDEFKSVSDQMFYTACIQQECGWEGQPGKFKCSDECAKIKAAMTAVPFDPEAMAKDLEEGVVKPLKEVQAAADGRPYLTRMFTLVSPDEMDKDPIFAWNPDLPTVDRVRKAKAKPVCPAGSKTATQAQLTFANGTTLLVDVPKEQTNCFGLGGPALPGGGFGSSAPPPKGKLVEKGGQPAYEVAVLDESGPPYIVDPLFAEKVDAQLNLAEVGKPSLTDEFKKGLGKSTWDPKKVGVIDTSKPPSTATTSSGSSSSGSSSGDSGCSAVPVAGLGGLTLLPLAGIALAFARRRRS